MLRHTFLVSSLVAISAVASAQLPASVNNLSTWPTTLKPGTDLILITKGQAAFPVHCHLRSIDNTQIVCARATPVIFERATISTITKVPSHWFRNLRIGLGVGAIGLAGGGVAARRGDIAIVGLVLTIPVAIMSYVVYLHDLAAPPAKGTPLYVAPPDPVPAP